MAINEKTLEQSNIHSLASLEESQRSFERQHEAYMRKVATFQERCQSLRKQTDGLEQERQVYEQERLRLWKNLQAERQLHNGSNSPVEHSNLQERIQMRQHFSDVLSHHRESFSTTLQMFHERLAVLREQRACLKALTDRTQQQEGYRQLQLTYLEIQRELQEYRQLLHEQTVSYSQLLLDYRDEQRRLRTQKLAI